MVSNKTWMLSALSAVLSLALVLLVSCGGSATRRDADGPTPAQGDAATFHQGLPALSVLNGQPAGQTRQTSRLIVQTGAEYFRTSPGAVQEGQEVRLDASATGPGAGIDFEWALYACGPVAGSFLDITVNTSSVDGQMFVAIPDFTAGRWLWYGPYVGGVGIGADPTSVVSATGVTYCAVASPRGSNLAVSNVTFNTDNDSGVFYPDPGAEEGQFSSIAVVDGKPAIAYAAGSGGAELRFIRALDNNGTIWGQPQVLDNGAVEYVTMAVVDGNPAVAYHDAVNGYLRYVRASDTAGVSWGSPLVLDSAAVTGQHASLAVVDGNPAISYYDSENGRLRFVRASDAQGASWNSPQTVDADGFVGRDNSLLVVAGRPAISYYSETAGALRYLRAEDATGSSWPVAQTLDTTDNTGQDTSLAIVGNFPAISYRDVTNDYLRYIRAGDPNGEAWGAPVTVDSSSIVGSYSKLITTPFGIPLIAYFDGADGDLRFVMSLDESGISWGTPQILDSEGSAGYELSMTLVNGKPAISYFNFSKLALSYTSVQ